MSATPYRRPVVPRSEPYQYWGCACFESSWELARGVQVIEGLSFEEYEQTLTGLRAPTLNSPACPTTMH